MSFREQLILNVIDKLAIGLLVLIAGYYVNKALERYKREQNTVLEKFKGEQSRILEELKGQLSLRKEYEVLRDQAALKHLQRQIEEFYSPLLGLIQQAGLIYSIAKQKYPQGRHTPNSEGWGYLVEKNFLKLNSQMSDLIRTKIYLLATEQLPETFQKFLVHSTQYDSLYTLWKDRGVSSDEVTIQGWPIGFEGDVKDTLDKLRNDYNKNLKHFRNAI